MLFYFLFKTLRDYFVFSINLEHNNLTSFGGLIHLVNLKVHAHLYLFSQIIRRDRIKNQLSHRDRL
jgi:hypothetical protein